MACGPLRGVPEVPASGAPDFYARITSSNQPTRVTVRPGTLTQAGETIIEIRVLAAGGRWETLAVVSESGNVIGRRVVVTGLAGAGKSTFALALAARTGLPVIHLDLEFWKPGWVAPSEDEWRAKQRVVLAGDAWIADGNYHQTLDVRVGLADTVVVLDMPWWICSARALRRGFVMPGELPAGCDYSRWARFRDEWRLAGRIWRKHRVEPEHERRVIAQLGHDLTVHVLTSPRNVDQFLDGLAADRVVVDDG